MNGAEKKKTIIRMAASAVVIAVLLLACYLLLHALGWTELTREQLQEYIESTGAVAPLVYVGVSFLQVTFVPIPAAVSILAGNYAFGTGWAFLYSYIGMLLGAMLAFSLGKWIGRPFVNWIAGGSEQVDKWIERLKGKEFVLLFFMFLFPFFPDDILCSIAALFPISWLGFFLIQLVTRATSIGATLLFMSGDVIPFNGWGIAVLALTAVIFIGAFVLCFRNTDKINAFLFSHGLIKPIKDRKEAKVNKAEIKDIIFDFGQVLVHFEPSYMVRCYVSDKDDADLLERVVFDRLYWDRLDAGTISDSEVICECRKRLPERLWDVTEKIYYNWIYNIPEIDGMRELVKYLKERYGVRLFLLSNISKYFASHSEEIPILSELDGCVFSAPIGITKPSREIFAHICEKYEITPEKALFIDDNGANIAGAADFGINTYHFDGDAQKLGEYLDKMLTDGN